MVAGGGGDTGATGGGATGVLPDTGTVNVMNAMEPEEVTAIQAIVDENIDADYTVELEADPDFEANLPIRAEGGTLDVALVPQPGAVQGMAADGTIVSLEDMGFDIDDLTSCSATTTCRSERSMASTTACRRTST